VNGRPVPRPLGKFYWVTGKHKGTMRHLGKSKLFLANGLAESIAEWPEGDMHNRPKKARREISRKT